MRVSRGKFTRFTTFLFTETRIKGEMRRLMRTEQTGLILAFLSSYKGAPVQSSLELIMCIRVLAKLGKRDLFH